MAKKQDVVAHFAQEFGETKSQSEDKIQFVLDTMYHLALDEGAVYFGNHKMGKKISKSRTGRNPQTGELLEIPAKTKVVYKRLNRD